MVELSDESTDDEVDAYCYARVGNLLKGKWHLDRLLGIGGMAAVYAATHRNGTIAALKVLHPHLGRHAAVRERFLREAYIANKCGHDGVVKVHDDDVDEGGCPFLVMELLTGESVADRADKQGARLPMLEALWVGHELLSVLEAAHAQGIVHRDIKPDNLFWTTEGKIKVLDFGIARIREETPAARRTRTGVVFGTPGYMAPEQALGRWSQVDARTDLWAVGATLFNLLTGGCVHEGETDNERTVNAATRPARSLARFYRGAPPKVVGVIDTALAFDQDKRYSNARAMREDLVLAMEEARASPASRLPAPAATTAAKEPEPEPEEEEDAGLDDVIQSMTPEAVESVRELLTLFEKAMKARLQYGADHKESERRMELAFADVAGALDAAPDGLAWHVRAYGFSAGDDVLWEPKPPLDRIPYRLFSDGVRAMALSPGLTPAEAAELLRILVADVSREIPPEDNLATLMWDAAFEHVAYEEAEDSFAEGEQAERAAFEKQRQEILALATLDTSAQMEDCWHDRPKGQKGDALAGPRALLHAIGAPSQARREGEPARLAMDDAALAVLAARLNVPVSDVGRRFADAAAAAFVLASRHGFGNEVAGPLRAAMDGLRGETAASDAVGLVTRLTAGIAVAARPEEAERLANELMLSLISQHTIDLIVDAAAASPDGPITASLAEILSKLDGRHLAKIARIVSKMPAIRLRDVLLEYVSRHARGHEGEIASAFAEAVLGASLALLKILVALRTPEARRAAQEASRSPHALVRIEALGHLEGVSGTALRPVLKAVLEDAEQGVRLAALRSIAEYRIKAAGPAIALRVKSPEFDALSAEERREALSTLFALMQSRAEIVCVELLSDTRLLQSDAHEKTRELAAEALGKRGYGPDSKVALENAAKGRWKNSDRVRQAAALALAAMEARGPGEGPPASRASYSSLPSMRPSSSFPAASAEPPGRPSQSSIPAQPARPSSLPASPGPIPSKPPPAPGRGKP